MFVSPIPDLDGRVGVPTPLCKHSLLQSRTQIEARVEAHYNPSMVLLGSDHLADTLDTPWELVIYERCRLKPPEPVHLQGGKIT